MWTVLGVILCLVGLFTLPGALIGGLLGFWGFGPFGAVAGVLVGLMLQVNLGK